VDRVGEILVSSPRLRNHVVLVEIIGEMEPHSAVSAPAIGLEPEAPFLGSDMALGVETVAV